jgi:hypothetical protein
MRVCQDASASGRHNKPSIIVDSLHRLLQLLGTGFDLTDVLSADTTIREEIVLAF